MDAALAVVAQSRRAAECREFIKITSWQTHYKSEYLPLHEFLFVMLWG